MTDANRFSVARVVVMMAVFAAAAGCGDSSAPANAPATGQSASDPRETARSAEGSAADARETFAVASLEIPYGETQDGLLRGHFAYPESMVEPLPAVIMMHDWWGLNDATKAAAEQLAAYGYMVLAIDFYAGEVAGTPERAGALSRQLLDNPEVADNSVRAGYDFLKNAAGAPVVATFGAAMGGYWSFKSSRLLPDQLAASVVFYGQVDTEEARIAEVDVPLLAVFAGADTSIRAKDVADFAATAEALDKQIQVHTLPNVRQSFANPDDRRFDAAAAQQAWDLTLDFLALHLTDR
ncbi:MAG: dienelactone hydrolase family protein [Pseudomonadota bacterium]